MSAPNSRTSVSECGPRERVDKTLPSVANQLRISYSCEVGAETVEYSLYHSRGFPVLFRPRRTRPSAAPRRCALQAGATVSDVASKRLRPIAPATALGYIADCVAVGRAGHEERLALEAGLERDTALRVRELHAASRPPLLGNPPAAAASHGMASKLCAWRHRDPWPCRACVPVLVCSHAGLQIAAAVEAHAAAGIGAVKRSLDEVGAAVEYSQVKVNYLKRDVIAAGGASTAAEYLLCLCVCGGGACACGWAHACVWVSCQRSMCRCVQAVGGRGGGLVCVCVCGVPRIQSDLMLCRGDPPTSWPWPWPCRWWLR